MSIFFSPDEKATLDSTDLKIMTLHIPLDSILSNSTKLALPVVAIPKKIKFSFQPSLKSIPEEHSPKVEGVVGGGQALPLL
jgi:hypothetical protein